MSDLPRRTRKYTPPPAEPTLAEPQPLSIEGTQRTGNGAGQYSKKLGDKATIGEVIQIAQRSAFVATQAAVKGVRIALLVSVVAFVLALAALVVAIR